MKKVEIRQFTHAEVDAPKETFGFLKMPIEHKLIRAEGEDLEVSDGYHTFDELYEHRIVLFIKLCEKWQTDLSEGMGLDMIWKSLKHSDYTMFPGWFVMGIFQAPEAQITYHLPISYWDDCYFAKILDKAPEWDGHTSQDVLQRLKQL